MQFVPKLLNYVSIVLASLFINSNFHRPDDQPLWEQMFLWFRVGGLLNTWELVVITWAQSLIFL